MKDKLEARIAAMETEHAKGVQRLGILRQEVERTEQTLFNIQGAIKVCQELIVEIEPRGPEMDPPADALPVRNGEKPIDFQENGR